jgi:hypothetical protein
MCHNWYAYANNVGLHAMVTCDQVRRIIHLKKCLFCSVTAIINMDTPHIPFFKTCFCSLSHHQVFDLFTYSCICLLHWSDVVKNDEYMVYPYLLLCDGTR